MRPTGIKYIWLAVSLLALAGAQAAASAPESEGFDPEAPDPAVLSIHVTGGQANTGQFFLSLFDSEENFLKAPLLENRLPADDQGQALFTLQELLPGDYAISLFYDQDNDDKLDTGFLGIPSELVGFSNNAKGRFGPPSFNAARFELSASMRIDIVLGKAKN